ncbi:LexA family protein [Massilia sp. TWP1-3-3]|uniref:LexA family protein n=1 Tax=Massilia sp. TWP1-3-3 TaxID=2804573 RepID=UPI003CEBDFBA
MAKRNHKERSGRVSAAETARIAALDAFLLATEGIGPEDVDRINAEWGLPAGATPSDMRLEPERVARSARLRGATEKDQPPTMESGDLREWATTDGKLGDERTAPTGSVFQVIAIGGSMIGAGIAAGSRLDARAASAALDGDIVLARVAGSGWLLRRWATIGGATVLCAENPQILGVAIDDANPPEIFGIVQGVDDGTPQR